MKHLKILKYGSLFLLILFTFSTTRAHSIFTSNKGLLESKFTPIQVGIFFDANLFEGFNPVYGVALSLPLSPNREVWGFSTGIIGGAEEHYGIQANIINLGFDIYGFQCGLMGVGAESCSGIQLNALCNSSSKVDGAQIGGANFSTEFSGLQLGLCNMLDRLHDNWDCYMNGVQIGAYNETKNLSGWQLGLVNLNFTDKNKKNSSCQFGIFNTTGESALQIGLLNYIKKGFFKYFPFFNFSVKQP